MLPAQGLVAMLFGGRASGHWAICPHSWQWRGRSYSLITKGLHRPWSCVTHVPEMGPYCTSVPA